MDYGAVGDIGVLVGWIVVRVAMWCAGVVDGFVVSSVVCWYGEWWCCEFCGVLCGAVMH